MNAIETWLPAPAAMGSMELDASFLAALVMFLLVYAFLSNVVIKPYVALVQKRDALTQGTKDTAVGMRVEAERVVAEYESSMQSARVEAAELREGLRREGQEEEARLVSDARAEVSRRMASSRAALAEQVGAARAQLDRRAEELAEEIAGRVAA